MRNILMLCVALIAAPLSAQSADVPTDGAVWQPLSAEGLTLEEFKWVARPVIVFADSPYDPAFIEQMELLVARADQLIERDVVVIFDSDPAAKSAIRQKLRPRGFSLVLLDKEGRVALRKPFPWDVRELSASIDKMPMRQQELRE